MKLSRIAAVVAALLGAPALLAASNGYYRFPAIQNDTVVFTAEGDLWATTIAGGNARRLTTHPAEESRAALSPDGKWVAFSANYEGPTEVYVMPLAGGLPKRISFENSRAFALGWTAQGEVLYSSQHDSGPNSLRVVGAIRPDTLARRVFPLADANDAVLDERGEYLYFVRFGLATTGDNARHYRGGAMAQLWRYQLSGKTEAERIGPLDANLRRPMWWNGKLIVVSDADGRDNLWQLNADGSQPRQLTRHTDFDVRAASQGGGRVVYQHGADLRVFDLASQRDQLLDIQLVSDFDQQRSRWVERPLRYATSTRLSADGERVVITARGRVTLAGVGPLRRVDLAQPAGSRLREAVSSPDGQWVYAIADSSGEQEIWRYPADGGESAKQLTQDGNTQRWRIFPSPDGKYLAHNDKRGRLWLLELASGRNSLIDDGSHVGVEEHDAIVWSPDSRAIALVRPASLRQLPQLGLYSLDRQRTDWLTSDKYPSAAPAFSPDGKWLWFLSDRQYQAPEGGPWGDRNTGARFDRRSKLYGLALQAGNRFPFQPKDELPAEKPAGEDKPADKADDKPAGKAPAKPALPAIAFEGLAERLYEVPLAAGNYRGLASDGKRLYYTEASGDGEKLDLKTLAIENTSPRPELFVSDIRSFALSRDGKKLFYRRGGESNEMYIVEAGAKPPADLAKSTVRIGDWSLRIDPRAEWRQMFADAWRMHRDYLYDRQLRGVDWPAKKQQFAPLIERISDRAELDDVLAQMMGELGSLHSQIASGELRRGPDVPAVAGLGAQLERVEGGWQIRHIYETERELPSERGPLQAPGLDVREGDLITAINGRSTAGLADPSELLRGQAGQQVLLTIQRAGEAARKIVVTPVSGQQQAALRYTDWEQSRKARVEAAGKGKLGYLHLRAMGGSDMAAFVREFYGQYERDGLIIDVRRNNGGNIDSWIIEKLLRRVWAFWQGPAGNTDSNMQQTFRGHLVVLTDALTYSDGETFAAGIQALKLGPLIGSRTAGAGVWLGDSNSLADNGRARVAELPQFGSDGRWLIEGVGVVPDIEVENPPHASFLGEDKQLETAIAWLQDKLAKAPIAALRPQPIPPLR